MSDSFVDEMTSSSSSAIRRIQRELKEINEQPSLHWCAGPVGDELFDWHFAVRGPSCTDFQGGIYTGRIVLPVNYPFAPPSITLLTPNGRFEVGKKICLNISNYHPELWQPAWGIRTMMEALRSLFPTPGDGAIGAVDSAPELRRRLAKESLEFVCPIREMKNRELLPPLTDEQAAAEGSPPPPESIAVVAALPKSIVGEEIVRADSTVTANSTALRDSPAQAAQAADESTAARDPASEVRWRGQASDVPETPSSAAQRRARQENAARIPLWMQLLKPPKTKREMLVAAVDCLICTASLAVLLIGLDVVRNPPPFT